jgi:hypothetical protein
LLRDKLFAELKEDILEMSKSKYAHFFVQKMLRYGTKEQRAHIFKTMEGNIAKVMGRFRISLLFGSKTSKVWAMLGNPDSCHLSNIQRNFRKKFNFTILNDLLPVPI